MYKIGDKVETPHGVGRVDKVFDSGLRVNFGGSKLIPLKDVKPYTSAHDKLIKLGYEFQQYDNFKKYMHDELATVRVDNDKTISCYEITLELSRILTQYLEELE